MSDIRPNHTVARCCRNCHYFTLTSSKKNMGLCNLPHDQTPPGEALKAHAVCVCDAHIWKKSKHIVHRPALLTGAKLPDDVL